MRGRLKWTLDHQANVQVIVDADTRLVVAAARPVPGTTADAKAWRDSGLAEHCQNVTVLGDGACINTGPVPLPVFTAFAGRSTGPYM